MYTLPWINFILGIWLIISPFVLGHTAQHDVLWNEIITGVLVVIFSGSLGGFLAQRTGYPSKESSRGSV
ncbi:MAG TPA: SPW repeat protein [Nitrospiria bacterium]|nr:SPW repeat protein [Nitrospiria bacterium]